MRAQVVVVVHKNQRTRVHGTVSFPGKESYFLPIKANHNAAKEQDFEGGKSKVVYNLPLHGHAALLEGVQR